MKGNWTLGTFNFEKIGSEELVVTDQFLPVIVNFPVIIICMSKSLAVLRWIKEKELEKSDDSRKTSPEGWWCKLFTLVWWWTMGEVKERNRAMNLVSLGGFLFHHLEVKHKLWHLHTVRWSRGWMTKFNCTSYRSNIITCHQLDFDVVLLCWILLIVCTRQMRKFTTNASYVVCL